jgi:hypothetical protein
VDNLSVGALSGDSITFAEPFHPPADLRHCDALMSVDRRLRLPLAGDGVTIDAADRVVGVTIKDLEEDYRISIVSYGRRDPRLESLAVEKLEPCRDHISVPEGYLIYPGSHELEMALE